MKVSSLPTGFQWQYSGAGDFKGRHAYNPTTGERISTRAAQDRQSQAHGFQSYSSERKAANPANRVEHASKEGEKSRSVKLKGVTDLEKAQKRLVERGQLKANTRTNFTIETKKRGYASRVVNSSESGSMSQAASVLATKYSEDQDIPDIEDLTLWEYD